MKSVRLSSISGGKNDHSNHVLRELKLQASGHQSGGQDPEKTRHHTRARSGRRWSFRRRTGWEADLLQT